MQDRGNVAGEAAGRSALGLIAGNTAAMFAGGSAVPLIKSGQLHALAVTSTKRSKVVHRRAVGHDRRPIRGADPGRQREVRQGIETIGAKIQ